MGLTGYLCVLYQGRLSNEGAGWDQMLRMVESLQAPYLLRFEVISLKFKTSGLWNYLHWE